MEEQMASADAPGENAQSDVMTQRRFSRTKKVGGPGTEEEERQVSMAIHASGIPTMVDAYEATSGGMTHTGFGLPVAMLRKVRWGWLFPWFLAIFLMDATFYGYGIGFHKVIWHELPADADISISAKGCDIAVVPNKYSTSRMSVEYWKTLAEASVTVKKQDVQVKATSSKRSITWKCAINLYPNDKQGLINSLKISLDPSDASKFNDGASNVAEVMDIHIDKAIIKNELTLDVQTYSDVKVIGTQVPQLTANIVGGVFAVHEATTGSMKHPAWATEEYKSVMHLPTSMNLNLKSATVVMAVHNADIKAKIAHDTIDDAILAGARVKSMGDDLYEISRSKSSGGSYTSVTLEANDCAIYFSAMDEEHYFGEEGVSGLEVSRGSSTQLGPRLLHSGVSAMNELDKHLKGTDVTSKFVVYFDLSGPHVPSGTFRLLSTKSYLAFSTTLFVMMSAGMLNPEVVRITTPIVGLDFLFPRTVAEGPLSKKEQVEFTKGTFHALSSTLDVNKLGKPGATWVWDPVGPDVFLFEYEPAQKDKPATWDYRLANSSDTSNFLICAGITALLAFLVGLILCKMIVFQLFPHIERSNMNLDVAASATYQLKYQAPLKTWSVNSTFVAFPVPGILLRWAKRPKQAQFNLLRVRVRAWPVKQHAPLVSCDCVPMKLPSPTGQPGQQAFLFPQTPRPMSDKKSKKKEPPCLPMYEFQLAAVARTVFSDTGLTVGCAYEVQLQAFDNPNGTGSPIDASNWTRPVVVKADLVFTEYPLMLLKTLLNMTPSDPFQYFLDVHCENVNKSPSMMLTVSNMHLAVINQLGLFAGPMEKYGENVGVDGSSITTALETLGSDMPKVHIVISTGDDAQNARDITYEATDYVPLISMGSKARIDGLKTFTEVTGNVEASAHSDQEFSKKTETGALAHKYHVFDFDTVTGKKQVLKLRTGQEMDQIVRFEAVTGTAAGGDNTETTARCEYSWRKLMKMVLDSKEIGDAGETMYHIDDQMVMRDGLTPAAFLMADIGVTNTHIAGKLPKATVAPGFHQVFKNVLPGSTFLWGEYLSLTWAAGLTSRKFRIGLVCRELEVDGKEIGDELSTLDTAEHDVIDGKANLKVAPYVNFTKHRFAAHYEATDPETNEIFANSAHFVVVKPVTMQELELGYAAFCSRNEMPFIPFGNARDLTIKNGLDFVNRSFSVIDHYRLPLPITGTGEPESDAFHSFNVEQNTGPPMVENPGSHMITGSLPVQIHHRDSFEVIESSDRKLDEEEGSAEMERVTTVTPKDVALDIACNIYWKNRSDWSTELLLLWRLLPTFAREGWLTGIFARNGFPKTGEKISWVDDVIRFGLQMFLWWFQMILLLGPVWVLFGVWVWHDSLMAQFDPNMGNKSEQAEESLFNFIIQPSLYKWVKLDENAKVVYTVGVLYSVGVFTLTLYGNFVHHVHPLHGFWLPLDAFTKYSFLAVLFALAFYASMAICWILMGSLINPQELMAYALMVAGISVLIKTNWTNLQGMKARAQNGLSSKLDIVMRALMTIFLGKAGAAKAVEAVEEKSSELMDYTDKIVAYLHATETSAKQLYWQSTIDLSVSAAEQSDILVLRESVGFKAQLPEFTQRNRVLATDFVPQKFWTAAQNRANQRHVIADTKKPPLPYMTNGHPTVDNEEITGFDLHLAQSIDSLVGIDPTSGEADDVRVLAQQLGLRPATAEMVHQAFHLANNQAAAADADIDNIVNAPLALGAVMQTVREETFFNLWLHGGITADDMANSATEEEMRKDSAKKQKIQGAPVHQYIKAMDKDEMLSLNAKIAHSLTTLLDWPTIGRKCAHFANETLPHVLTIQRIERELNPTIDGSAAFKVRLFAGEQVYKSYDQVYKKNPVQFFIDCGIIKAECLSNPKCKHVVDSAMKKGMLCDGSIDQAGLLVALDWIVNPITHGSSVRADGIVTKMYLWEGALHAILDGLGWSKEEMDPTWLNAAWLEITEGQGVYAYEEVDEISVLICQRLAEGGLWKSVMKTFCFDVNIGGYVCCDVGELGEEKSSDLAHQIRLAGAAGKMTLDFMDSIVRWPAWVKKIWNDLSNATMFNDGTGPRFLPVSMMDDFLEGLVYKDVDEKVVAATEKVQMNKYPQCPDDLQWRVSADHSIWQVSPTGTKRLRGIWMELYMNVCSSMNCLPVDLDLYLANLKWQLANDSKGVPVLHLVSMKTWLLEEYLEAQRVVGSFTIAWTQFSKLLTDYMDFNVNLDVIHAQVFLPCAHVPGDDMCELRYLHDLGAALRLWMGYGVWKGAVMQILIKMCPQGAKRDNALKLCLQEFDALDTEGLGILQPGQLRLLLLKLLHPGLDLQETVMVVNMDLGLKIPEREVHKYFCTVDVNGDGILQATEFVSFLQVIMTNFYPQHIVNNLGFSTSAIIKILLTLVLVLGGLFVAITLVIKSFASGPVAATIHSSCSAGSSYLVKAQGDASSGGGQPAGEITLKVEAMVMTAVTGILGLAPPVLDQLKQLMQELL